MSAVIRIPRGWGWVWAIAAAELLILAFDAVPVFLSAPAAVSEGRAVTIAGQTVPRASLQPILDFQPFGAPAAPIEEALPPEADPPVEQSVSLILQGILQRNDTSASRAIVSSDGGTAGIYAIGDILPGGGTVSGIEADRILIDDGGQTQSLGFPDPGTAQDATAGDATDATDATDAANVSADILANSATDVLAGKPKAPQLDLRHLIPGLAPDPTNAP